MLSDATTLVFPPDGQACLPLLFDAGVLCCAAAGPAGRPLRVLIDTGTDPSAIDLALARQLDLRLGAFAIGQGAASDNVLFTETVLPWLRLGSLMVRDLFALALDLGAMPFGVDLVLGYNVLRQLVLHINYRQQCMLLRHPDLGAPDTVHAQMVPLTFFEHFPAFTDATLDDQLDLPLVTIDTGSNGGLTVGPDLAEQLGLTMGATGVSYERGAGFGGGGAVVRRRAESLRLGPFVMRDIDLDTHLGAGGDFGRAGRANLGNAALARFAALTLDYGREQAWIME
jgi:hypothetical protein